VPFLAITGLTGEEQRHRASQAGADAILGKPFTRQELVGLIEMHLSRAAAREPQGERPTEAGAPTYE
jgi:DNA-binding response OmpR family regulator